MLHSRESGNLIEAKKDSRFRGNEFDVRNNGFKKNQQKSIVLKSKLVVILLKTRRMNVSIKREQSQTCLSFTEREKRLMK
jgi:predicted lactoylglutathione lyase